MYPSDTNYTLLVEPTGRYFSLVKKSKHVTFGCTPKYKLFLADIICWCLDKAVRCLIWPDYVLFEQKHVAEFSILITVYIVVLLTGINYYIIAIHNRMTTIKIENCG